MKIQFLPVNMSQIPIQVRVTTTAIPASVETLTESMGSSCLSVNLKNKIITPTGSPCSSRISGEMKIRELQNREFQGPRIWV